MPAEPRRRAGQLLAGLRGRPVLPVLAVLTVLAAGCSGGGAKAPSPTTPGPTTSTLPVVTTIPPPSPQALQQIVVQSRDLPAGWTATPVNPPSVQAVSADTAALAACMGTTATTADVFAVAHSVYYVSGLQAVASTATSFHSTTDVAADTAVLTNAKAAACGLQIRKASLAARLPKGAVVTSDTLKITPGPGSGPSNVVAKSISTTSYRLAGHVVTLNDETVYLTGPRIEAHIDFYNVGTAISVPVRTAVIDAVSQRILAAS